MTELIVKKEGFVRVGVGVAEDATEGVGYIMVGVGPAVVEVVRRFGIDRGAIYGRVVLREVIVMEEEY